MIKIDQILTTAETFSEIKHEFPVQPGQPAEFEMAGYAFQITDEVLESGDHLDIVRKISGVPISETTGSVVNDGISIGFTLQIGDGSRTYRFCVPSMIYSAEGEGRECLRHSYMEDRLTGPMILIYDEEDGSSIRFSKIGPSRFVTPAVREKGDSRYYHKTHNVSLGFDVKDQGDVYLDSFWPYFEGDRSAALSSDERPARAFYPLDGEKIEVEFRYRMTEDQDPSFAAASYKAYERLSEEMKQLGEQVVNLPCTIEESRQYRMVSLGKSYREFGGEGAGFFFHFDPLYGYGSRPSGFSTCYDTIPHNSYTHILEYGFTGRQINAVYIMASEKGGEWIARGEKVIDFFLKKCQLDNGWLYSLYDLNVDAPFFSFGDPEAPKLHYVSKTNHKGNYLRTMTEPMNDLIECYRLYKGFGETHDDWKAAAIRYADFLLKYQNEDGSWFRAYCPDGTGTDAIDRPDLESEAAIKGQKSVTSIPLVFLENVCRLLVEEGEDPSVYRESAVRAGEYVLGDMVKAEHYQGATLDNPNQVDKEAAQYVMAGLCRLYLLTKDERYLNGAENAAFFFTTWNYIWNAPMQKYTILDQKGFCTKGMGAINNVWGGGVVDIYSLFHIRELYLVGKLRQHPFMCEMAGWIARATSQIMSRPDDDMGFTDIGMQPEGFGICPQGIDEGMISKGDIWGTLGWIYSAGIYGLNNYLMIKEEQ